MVIDNYVNKGLTRRDFLKKSGQAGKSALAIKAAQAIGFGLTLEELLGCATISFKEEAPVIYPPLKGHKVQPVEEGCFFGLRGYALENYLEELGVGPKIYLWESFGPAAGGFEDFLFEKTLKQGSIPFVYLLGNLKYLDIFEKDAENLADSTLEYKQPFFITTMHEMNGNWFSWGQKPNQFKDAWRKVWNIFEDTGANEYATWVWEVYSIENKSADRPERYYPGDKYVDWIGLSAYSRSMFPSGQMSFSSITGLTYHDMRRSHPNKPVMMAEFGKTKGRYQARWLKEAFETIKSWPGMKAAIFWDSKNWDLPDDHTLTEESKNVLKEILKDDYFIGIK